MIAGGSVLLFEQFTRYSLTAFSGDDGSMQTAALLKRIPKWTSLPLLDGSSLSAQRPKVARHRLASSIISTPATRRYHSRAHRSRRVTAHWRRTTLKPPGCTVQGGGKRRSVIALQQSASISSCERCMITNYRRAITGTRWLRAEDSRLQQRGGRQWPLEPTESIFTLLRRW